MGGAAGVRASSRFFSAGGCTPAFFPPNSASQRCREPREAAAGAPARRPTCDTRAAIAGIKSDLSADGMKDMGRVMAELKARHGAELDMGLASRLVKEALS